MRPWEELPLVEVEWLDSTQAPGWLSTSEVEVIVKDPDPERCRTVGYLIRDWDEWLLLASSVSGHEAASQLIFIPYFAVVEITVLRPGC